MATFTAAQLKTRLNTKLRDSADRTFSSSEKDEFYTTACEDEYVYKITKDTSLTVVAGSFSYALPTGFTEVTDFGFDANGYGGGSDWLSVKDITATTNTWYAGANSTNVSGNTNVTFSAAPAGVVSSGLLLMGCG